MLNIITLNVNGLASNNASVPKRRKIFTWLKTQRCDIALLQETHCTDSMQHILSHEWGGDSFFSNGSSDSRGVCILVRRGLNVDVQEIRKDDQGRLIFVKGVVDGKSILFGNIYCPNTDEVESILNVNNWLSEIPADNIVLGGDFNITLDPIRDREWLNQRVMRDYCMNRSRAVRETLDEFRLVDVWRKEHPDESQFTFSRGESRSRLDYFFISEHLCLPGTHVKCEIMPPFLADHRAVQLNFCPVNQSRGPGYWKFNNVLLTDEAFVDEVSSFIQEALTLNDTQGLSRVLLFDTVLCMVRGKIIQYASRKKREKNERLQELEKVISVKSNANIRDDELQRAIEERDEIIEARTKNNMLRCKVNWAAYAERSSSYFFSLEQRKASYRWIPALFLNHSKDTGELSENVHQMMNECSAFYGKLYERRPISNNETHSFLESINCISDSQREGCESQITAAELTAALSSLKPNTAPGPCGWTAEFFKKFWDILCPLFLAVVNEIYERGSLPESFSTSVITLIPKKGKDKRCVENQRPISLLPVPYKIIAKAMALRLKKVVGDIVHTDQTGFLKGRYIGENIRLIMDLMEYTSRKKIKGLLMQCDFLKAYDSISWEYLNKVVRAYGFGETFQRWMGVFYPIGAHCSSRVNVNNYLSPSFQIERGIRQGCPLSCLIWLLCMEPLLIKIRANDEIKGITVSEKEIKLSAYADDLTVILDGSEDSLRNTVSVFHKFSAASGLQLNMNKTVCSWIGSARHRPNPICQELNLQWLNEDEGLDILGVKVFADSERTKEVNYSHKLAEIEKTMSPWMQRSLTPLGKVILVKSLLLAKFVHLFAVIENPDKRYIAKLESLIFQFVWGKKDKIKRGIAKKQFLEGGISSPDVESFANALKISWIKRWLDPKEASWKVLMKDCFEVSDRIHIFQCSIGELQIRSRNLSKFWDQTLAAWAQILQNSGETKEFMAQVLFFNRSLNIESSLTNTQLRTMKEQNIIYVKDLYNLSLNRWCTALEIKQKFNRLDIMTCNSLVSMIPSTWRPAERCRESRLNRVRVLDTLLTGESVTKWAYRMLLEPKLIETCSCERKWSFEIGAPPDWKKLIKHLTESTKSIELRWFQFRLLHRILPTRKMLKIFRLIENDQCVFCKRATETVTHLFVDCPKVRCFWDEIWRAFAESNVAYRNLTLSRQTILYGVDSNKRYDLNLFLLLAKWFIWKQSKSESVVNVQLFLKHLRSFYTVQVCVYSLHGKQREFSLLWSATEKAINKLSA